MCKTNKATDIKYYHIIKYYLIKHNIMINKYEARINNLF